jgi:hypothetical protein
MSYCVSTLLGFAEAEGGKLYTYMHACRVSDADCLLCTDDLHGHLNIGVRQTWLHGVTHQYSVP